MRRRWLAAVGVALGVAACTYDFHAFDQAPATASDASTASDAPASSDAGTDSPLAPFDAASIDATGCPGEPACLNRAIACASLCQQAEQTCEGKVGCNLSSSCVQACKADETGCKQTCVDDCSACTSDAGCADPLSCKSAAQ